MHDTMPPEFRDADVIGKGVELYDEEKLGVVRATHVAGDGRRYLVVTSDLFGTGRYWVPVAEIQRIGPDRILLKITRDDLAELDWLSEPA